MSTLSRTFLFVASVVALLLVPALGGCANNSRTVRGKVVLGEASVVTVVDAEDERVARAGHGGVLVKLMRPGGGTASMAEATSLADGTFSMKLTTTQAMAGRVEVVASGADVLHCRGSVYVPSEDRRLLVFVEPKRGTAAEDGSR
ncbi:MAG: hypothetical protein HND58_12780 [Planctomycetota bacterium]|nr:MAG: hypothetical protein HND58_12780 [Planctomycetota bacterium]